MSAIESNKLMPGGKMTVGDVRNEDLQWARSLDFYLQENALLKLRLSQVLDLNPAQGFTAVAEHFQTSFIQLDECMKDLKKDIQLNKKTSGESEQLAETAALWQPAARKRFQLEMKRLAENFEQMKAEFVRQVDQLFPVNSP
ncbi:MAG: hypothetical protein Q7T76_12190 [Ferruginibacter sp.]|nr:hypothetical protein [Ferruginibacter sp.]